MTQSINCVIFNLNKFKFKSDVPKAVEILADILQNSK
jgi:hypothetical protein